jgi:hypothetical protein
MNLNDFKSRTGIGIEPADIAFGIQVVRKSEFKRS